MANVMRGGRGRFRLIDKDRGYKKLFRDFEQMRGRGANSVTVGIHAAEGGETHVAEGSFSAVDGNRPSPDAGLTVAAVGSFHEFGLGNNPERSFIRAWFDERLTTNQNILARLMKRVVKGKLSLADALSQFGANAAGNVQARIARGIPPRLAPETIRRKGSSKPLINTGQLRNAVSYQVFHSAQSLNVSR